MTLFPRFSKRRRVLQLGWYGLKHGTRLFDRLNATNLFLARQFDGVRIRCNVCGQMAGIWYGMHSAPERAEHRVGLLRETLECKLCTSRMRYRVMAHGLLDELRRTSGTAAASLSEAGPHLASIHVLDTDAFSPLAQLMSGRDRYKLSSYRPDRLSGDVDEHGVFNVDLQDMAWPDGTFDVILSSEVMEHVRDLERAHREILRCLKPGGVHIFTVPFSDPPPLTRPLIDTTSGRDIYLQRPQIHGDDRLSGGIPTYRIFGLDILDHLRAAGFEAEMVRIGANDSGIFDGLYFTARRPRSPSGASAGRAGAPGRGSARLSEGGPAPPLSLAPR